MSDICRMVLGDLHSTRDLTDAIYSHLLCPLIRKSLRGTKSVLSPAVRSLKFISLDFKVKLYRCIETPFFDSTSLHPHKSIGRKELSAWRPI